MRKRIIVFSLMAAMMIIGTGCGNKIAEKEPEDTDAAEASDTCKFVSDMKIGWNLGNTFDA